TSTSSRLPLDRSDSGRGPTLLMRLPSITSASLATGGRAEPSISVPWRTTSVRSVAAALDMQHDLQGVADPLRVGAERVVNLIEPEVVADDRIGQDLALAHQLERAAAVHPALAARGVDAHVGAHGQVHVDLDRPVVPGDHADPSAALDVLERLLHRRGAARALEHAVGAPPAGDLTNPFAEIFAADVC